MPRTTGGKDPIAKYQAEPPPWLTTSHGAADLGYHGFHPPRREQEEDMLSENNVKNGYSAPQTIGAETFSSHNLNLTRDRFVNENALSELEDLMNQVLSRRAELQSNIPEHAFKLPQRITLSEVRRQTWHADFLNSEVALHTIGEKIPHAKGHDLLTMLQENQVPIPRAIWYVRGLGGNETQGMRNRINYNPTQYSVEWANVVTSYLKKLLAEIALPSAARPGLNIKQTFKGVLNDTETRDKWVSKFCYCLDLLREFYAESLVDHGTFLSWLAQQLSMSNLAQANFVVRIADEYLEGMLPYRGLQRALIDGCLAKHLEIQSIVGIQHLASLVTAISSLLQRMFLYNPDSFVNPRAWINHAPSIIQVLGDSSTHTALDSRHLFWTLTIESDLDDIARRNNALLFRTIPERATATAEFTMNDVKFLNSIIHTTELSNVSLLPMSFNEIPGFVNKLGMLLTWSITQHQYGDHRPYVVTTLIAQWREQSEERALRRGFPPPDELLQDCLFNWLDTSDIVTEPLNLPGMVIVFGELVARTLFSYSKYIQRLIARGEHGLLATQTPPSRHRALLRSLPLGEPNGSLANQRKVALYGISCRTTPEDQREKEMRAMLRKCIPELFAGTPLSMDSPVPLDLTLLTATSRYEQVRVLRHWLYPIFVNHIQRCPSAGEVISMQTYVSLMHILVLVRSYDIILDANLKLIICTTTPELLAAVVDTLRRYADIWACMDAQGRLLEALCNAHETWNWATHRAQCRPVLCLLIEYHNNPHMSEEAKVRVSEDATALMQGLRPPMSPTQREQNMFSRISILIHEDDASLATNIWLRHGFSTTWVHEVWQSTFNSLRELTSVLPMIEVRHVSIMRYAQFLWDVDQYLRPGALDELMFQWATGSGYTELQRLDDDTWATLSTVLLYLVTRDALTASTIMKGIVYPVWELCTTASGPSAAVMLFSINHIASKLLVHDLTNVTTPTSEQLDQMQKLQTRRRGIYNEEDFNLLVIGLPHLVSLEHRSDIDEKLRSSTAQLRIAISKHSEFRMVAYRNIEMVSRVFWNLDSDPLPQELERHLGDALQQIISDSDPWVLKIDDFEWRTLSCFLSPWRYSRTAIELQLALRSLGACLRDETTREKAENELSKFGSSFFGQSLTSEETDLIADMLRGISGVVACKLVNSGMQRLTHLFRDLSNFPQCTSKPLLHNVGEVLHLMSSILQPLRAETSSLPQLEPDVQDAFVNIFWSATEQLDQFYSSTDVSGEVTELLVIVARIWQFDLCLPGAWTLRLREVVGDVLTTIVRLSMKYSCGTLASSVVFDVLIDTAFVLFDEIPRETKTTNMDIFQYVANVRKEEFPPDMPMLHRKRIESILAYVPQDSYVHNLVHTWHDASGTLLFGRDVQNNPWEWAESIEPAVSTSTFNREKPVLRNSSSLPLELFGTRPTGERVIGELPDAGEAAMRQLEDGLAADSVFARDWRETRVELPTDLRTRGDGEVGVPEHPDSTEYRTVVSPAGSPAPTLRSQQSSTASQRAGSVLSAESHGRSAGLGDGDPSAPGSTGTRGSKRKASTASLELDLPAAPVRGGRRGRGRGTGTGTGRGKGKKK